ncbi:DnaJ like subfamily B member 14, partial [Pseudolycoriella hygida]
MAKEAFSQYDVQRARRLLNKAEKLHPSQDAKELLEEAKIYVDQHCRQILRCKNHYDVLEVPKDATTAAIKQAYKRFSLFIHPDKNESSYTDDATEAQRKLCRANEVLTDLSERRIYDSELLKEERHHQPNTNAETYE